MLTIVGEPRPPGHFGASISPERDGVTRPRTQQSPVRGPVTSHAAMVELADR
ncbi:hypothetical protein ACFOLD_12185 [Kocuria carniphila]|uniref:hypothetical protein n=1 Tax=Kocuria carniphila TaxID=262208 RepID=UPI0036066695